MSFSGNPTLDAWMVGIVCGLIAHHGIFIKGEWHIQAPRIIVGHLWIFFVLTLASYITRGHGFGKIFDVLLLMSSGYLPGLLFSIIIYRFFFHQLTQTTFPGPWYARITKLWHVWACRDSKNHVVLNRLQNKYGDFVRTGPSELTIFRPEIFMALDGPHSECMKSDWYDLLIPNLALVTARDRGTHAVRRRQWNRAFSTKALQLHDRKIMRHLDELDRHIEAEAKGRRVSNARNLFYWFAFDAMGDFVLGKSFGMQQNQEWHHVIFRLQRALSLLGPLSPAPWLIHVGFQLAPRILQLKDWFDMVAWCQTQMDMRIKDSSRYQEPDITHYIMMEDVENQKIIDDARAWLSGDSLQAIVAGSGPIANALLGTFTELGRDHTTQEKLYYELMDIDVSDTKVLANLPFLNACIDETLRLYPALMTGGTRMTTQKGMTIAGRFIPPYTNIVAPQYLISRRQDCFVDPLKFVPERWTTSPEMLLNPSATKPFGTGHTSCVGRPLAIDSLRFVIARLVKKYQFSFAPGEDGSGMGEHLKDQFVPNPGSLHLCFELR
ncbi:cytochrome P450 [Daldinia decipiens]|uniref:cytochrome P450 n=1 Tax=Daldinia decipiens TaxID=326647 RepID=UPI0020C5A969|nr:cytochrome P450 [Daldinia decipiens]KAI1662063.1 cytochrome P450 [Daldinia decipiens]